MQRDSKDNEMIHDARGQHMKLKLFDNFAMVSKYRTNNPTASKKQMARALGLSVQTVMKHIKELKQED